MGLTVCPDCASDVSDQAPRCPKCGRILAAAYANRGWSPLIIPGLILIVVGVGLFFFLSEMLGIIGILTGILTAVAGIAMLFIGLFQNLRSP